MNRRIAVFLERPRIKVLANRFAKQLAFVRARLSLQSYLGLQLTVGAVVLIGASWLFGGIAEDVVTGDPLTIADVLIAPVAARAYAAAVDPFHAGRHAAS